jgi:hypothetical protein
MSTEPMSLRAYARHRGVSLRAVQKALASGRITARKDGRLDADVLPSVSPLRLMLGRRASACGGA